MTKSQAYDCLDITRSTWVMDLYRARPDSGWPRVDTRHMTHDDAQAVADYLRASDPSLSDDDMEYSRGAADQIEALLSQSVIEAKGGR